MTEVKRPTINWMDVLWLVLLAGLAVLPPVRESHKQLILLAFGVLQLSEGWLIARMPRRGPAYLVLLKIALGHAAHRSHRRTRDQQLLLSDLLSACGHRGGIFRPLGHIALDGAGLGRLLFLSLSLQWQEFEITVGELRTAGHPHSVLLSRGHGSEPFCGREPADQTQRYQELAETLAETNRRLEQAQAEARRSERLAALGQLSAGLAHEIRNPLGVIKGSAEMLTQKLGESNPLATELAGYISTETNRLSALVTRFLDFARPLARRSDAAGHHRRSRSRA